MLEVVRLTKIYKAKGGVETKALDEVSLRFPEKGMVFLLGKSGSGKSTLLNVCGGLDSPTSGEVIVKGRSSKDFSQSDFDSYRNTFVGFVFQEYNILNEFTVEDNIALALELQGKPKNKAAIKQLLDDVDLSEYAHRKPNTLSGGQKQRIAIARALIKQPEIIMADEPTGALDSNTGKQVFDTLKKLSEQKLVIVVSHDRDFAEEYADRIIELKDGKILSDVSKTEAPAQSLGDNLEVVGDNTLTVKNGAALTEEDYRHIREFLSAHGNAILASGEKEISDFKKVSHITEDGGKEFFESTDESVLPKKDYDPKQTKFIRSRLPIRHAFKIGVSGLKVKPFRLIFTILLCSVAFVMFGLFSTLMLYDKNETLYQTFHDSGATVLRTDKRYKVTNSYDDYSYDDVYHTRMTEQDLQSVANKFGGKTFGVSALLRASSYVGSGFSASTSTIRNVNTSSQSLGSYYSADLRYAGYLPENHPFRNEITLGTYPVHDDEVLISSYTANVLLAARYEDAQSLNDLLGEAISFDIAYSSGVYTVNFKITGVFDSGDDALAAKYTDFKQESPVRDEETLSKMQIMRQEIEDGYHQIVFFNESRTAAIRNASKAQSPDFFQQQLSYSHRVSYYRESEYYYSSYYAKSSWLGNAGKTVFKTGTSTLSSGNAVVSLNLFNQYLSAQRNEQFVHDLQNAIGESSDDVWHWLGGNNVPSADESSRYDAYQRFLSLTSEGGQFYERARNYKFLTTPFSIAGIDSSHSYDLASWVLIAQGYQNLGSENATEEQCNIILSHIIDKIAPFNKFSAISLQVVAQGSQGESCVGEEKTLNIVGFSTYDNSPVVFLHESDYESFKEVSDLYNEYQSSSSTVSTNYQESENGLYDVVFAPYDPSLKSALSMFTYEYAADDSRIAIGNNVSLSLEMVNSLVDELSQIFLWVGVVFAAFAMLLLSSFIATSISYKKKEIGILRAVGARGTDVFKIFFSESFVIALICFFIGVAGSVGVCEILNSEINSAVHASLFVFGGVSAAILFGIALLTSAAATFLPVFSAAKKKPVESIRAL